MRHPCDTHVNSCVSHGYEMRIIRVQNKRQRTMKCRGRPACLPASSGGVQSLPRVPRKGISGSIRSHRDMPPEFRRNSIFGSVRNPDKIPASSGGAIFHSPGWSDRGPRQTACGLVGWDRNRKPLAVFWGGGAEPRVKPQKDDDFGLIPHPLS